MNGLNQWLRQFWARCSAGFRHFMTGRYGNDKLNTTILWAGVIACILGLFVKAPVIDLFLTTFSYGLMIWALFRMLSRNTYKRYQENRKFLRLQMRLKDREHRYFNCPKCRQPVRVPKGKGKISISCPKCGEKFIKKT